MTDTTASTDRSTSTAWLDAEIALRKQEKIDRLREQAASLGYRLEPVTTPDELSTLREENTHLRAALAMSERPCVYCSLPAADQAKCPSGFPGCARADDQMGCPELGARLEADALRAQLAEAQAALKRFQPSNVFNNSYADDHIVYMNLGDLRNAARVLSSQPDMARQLQAEAFAAAINEAESLAASWGCSILGGGDTSAEDFELITSSIGPNIADAIRAIPNPYRSES